MRPKQQSARPPNSSTAMLAIQLSSGACREPPRLQWCEIPSFLNLISLRLLVFQALFLNISHRQLRHQSTAASSTVSTLLSTNIANLMSRRQRFLILHSPEEPANLHSPFNRWTHLSCPHPLRNDIYPEYPLYHNHHPPATSPLISMPTPSMPFLSACMRSTMIGSLICLLHPLVLERRVP